MSYRVDLVNFIDHIFECFALCSLGRSAIVEHMFVSTLALAKQRREVDAIEAQWLANLAEFDRSGDWAIDGFLSAAAALASTCRMDPGVARHYVELARSLAR